MRRLFSILMTLILMAGLTGCSLFKKGGTSTPAPVPPPSAVPPPKFPTSGSSDPLNGKSDGAAPFPTAGATASSATGTTVLAGRVLDGFSRPPGNTYVRVVTLEGNEERDGQDIAVSPEGYFTIQNLKTGGQYKLVARGKQGERAVAGIHYATAPNVRVLIQVKEDLVSSATPAVPGPFGSLKDEKPQSLVQQPNPVTPVGIPGKTGWQPGPGRTDNPGELTLPAVHVPPGVPIADNRTWLPPTLEIKGPKANPAPLMAKINPIDALPPPPPVPDSLGPTKVPSCVLVGRTLVNFALNDINGEPWELKSSRKGKLVLLDFWGTWCMPCRQTMPALKGLQQRFGGHGLEVVGIAYEQGGTPQEQAYKVNEVCQKLLINYRQLLGSGNNCIVKAQLGVRGFPTLILVDEQGLILWRHEGRPNSAELEELERVIQSKLR